MTLTCFEVDQDKAARAPVVHGWTDDGYDLEYEIEGFWDWLKSAVDDMREWVELTESEAAE